MENSFGNFIKNYKSALILLPQNPQLDFVASGLSLFLALKKEYEVNISCSSPMTVTFNRLVGVDKIRESYGNKNLVISFENYDATAIERVSADSDDGLFRLTVVTKENYDPPLDENLKISYSGVSSQLVILIGGRDQKDFPQITSSEFEGVKIVHIGVTEISLPSSLEIISFARPSSSVSELVAFYIKEFTEFDSDIASNLLIGIYSGSRNFTSSRVSVDTFKISGELLGAGGRIPSTNELARRQTGFNPADLRSAFSMEKPDVESTNPPSEWMQTPKIYKGTKNIS